MAPSSINQGNAPTTLTLFPFHNDPRSRQAQTLRPPRIPQQPTTPPIPHLYIRNPRNPTLAPAISTANQTTIVRNARPAVVPSRTNPAATTRNAPRAPTVAVKSNTSTALSPRVRAPTQTTRNPITAVAKVHAIAPVAGITSIDSVLRADSKQIKEKPIVPDHIRPKAEAINTASPMVAIKLQQESTAESPFMLHAHEDVLTRSSAVLQTMLKATDHADPPKQKQREITLEKSDAKSTNIYINWLYTGKIHAGHRKDDFPTTTASTPASTSKSTKPETHSGLSLLVRSYLLGTHIRDTSFLDAVLDAIVVLVCAGKAQGKTMLGLLMQRVKHHYVQLPVGSNARRLFVHLFAHFGDWRLLEKTDSHTFLLETMEVIMRGAADDPTSKAGRCGFHEHGEGVRCYRQDGE